MVKSIFYVSEKTTPWPDDGPDVEAITTVARARNADLDVTGALISTGRHFAQILEGTAEAVDEVMESIVRDPRHHDLIVLQDTTRPVRWFAQWSLAFAGRPANIAERLEPLLADRPKTPEELDRLLQMIRALDRPGGADGRYRT